MIRFMRSAKVAPGKAQEALQWAKEAGEHYQTSFGIPIQVFVERFGNPGTIWWVGEAEDIATLDRNWDEWPQKPGWRELNERNVSLFVPGSVRDHLLRAS